MDWPFGHLVPLRYRAILIDPPWRFILQNEKTGAAKSPQAHYQCWDLDQIQALPVSSLAAPDCLLVMWATYPMLQEGLDTLKAWGFRYVSGGSWAKQSSTGRAWAFGPGYVFRSAAEPYLAGAIGRPRYGSKSVRNLIVAPVRQHSRKPDEIYDHIEALIDGGPWCEVFATQERSGWDSWGDQLGKFEGAA